MTRALAIVFSLLLVGAILPRRAADDAPPGGVQCTDADFCVSWENSTCAGEAPDTDNCDAAGTCSCDCQAGGTDCPGSGRWGGSGPPGGIPDGVFVAQAGSGGGTGNGFGQGYEERIGRPTQKWWQLCMLRNGSDSSPYSNSIVLTDTQFNPLGYGAQIQYTDMSIRAICANGNNGSVGVPIPQDQWVSVTIMQDGRTEAAGGGGDVRIWVDSDPSVDPPDSWADCTQTSPVNTGSTFRFGFDLNSGSRNSVVWAFDSLAGWETEPPGKLDCGG